MTDIADRLENLWDVTDDPKERELYATACGEIRRLRADKDVARSQARNAAYEADIEQLRVAVEDAIDTLEAMNLHVDNPLYERLRGVLEQEPTAC